ncbi:MAG: heavy metal translocating P-type ATPase [Anaerolineaceae bacterium]|jgi:Cd2+/Zn2+-exporting ATPase
MNKVIIPLQGVTCKDCAAVIAPSLKSMKGVADAELDFVRGEVTVSGEALDLRALKRRLSDLGFPVRDSTPKPAAQSQRILDFKGLWQYFWQLEDLKYIIPGLILLLFSLLLPGFGVPEAWVMIIQLLLLPLAGLPVFRNGFISFFKEKVLNINFLMSLAAIGAVIISETHEALIMLVLFTVSETMDGYTSDQARKVLLEFADLAPKQALKLTTSGEALVPVEELGIDDVIIVRPGERFPMDGIVLEGSSEVNQAPITGESRLVPKHTGDTVLSSTINGQGVLKVRVSKLAKDNTIQRIIALVTEAQANKANQEKFIDRFAAVYTPIVVLIATLIIAIPPLFFGQPLWNTAAGYGWLHRGLSLLMIGCPCALVISTPITLISGLTRAAREGVVFKGGIFLENLSRIRVMAFDKTGTLTLGVPRVSEVKAVDCVEQTGDEVCEPCDNLVAVASAVEASSSHPLGQAVLAEAANRGVLTRYASAVEGRNLDGKGQEGWVAGKLATVGSLLLFLEEHNDHLPEAVAQGSLEAEKKGQTTMLVCDGERVLGYMGVQDALRREAPEIIKELKELGIQTVMLTGDNLSVANEIGSRVGMSEVHAGLLPAEKLNLMDQLGKDGKLVAMVGDGINDSPALAKADVGIAMGGAGNAQVLETADMVLMDDKLSKLPFAVRLARFTNALIRQNIYISLIIKLIVAILAILGLTPLWAAVLADIGISLGVTLNGMRASRFKYAE